MGDDVVGEAVDRAADHDEIEPPLVGFVERFSAARAYVQGTGGKGLNVHRRAAQKNELAVESLLLEKTGKGQFTGLGKYVDQSYLQDALKELPKR